MFTSISCQFELLISTVHDQEDVKIIFLKCIEKLSNKGTFEKWYIFFFTFLAGL